MRHRFGHSVKTMVVCGLVWGSVSVVRAEVAAIAVAGAVQSRAVELEDGTIQAGELRFDSWQAYVTSDYFQANGLRCGVSPSGVDLRGVPSDCSYNSTNPAVEYDPSVAYYRIPVVVHVLRNSSGSTGNISAAMVQSQIDILNEDFLTIAGSLGQNGTDVQIEFYLATTDPSGNPTTGITYSNNTTWYNDGGSYWNSLAWDTNNYMNFYTNSAGGYLGYVPDLPQGGIAGSNADRVVILWSSFGRNAPIGPPYNKGRTTTHEVGHYLGLYHTFDNGCGTSSCYTTGDRVCDTSKESVPNYGCSANTSCGTPDPIENYMDYTDDLCMTEFTPEQARRIRCSLENYRSNLYEITGGATCSDGVQNQGEDMIDCGGPCPSCDCLSDVDCSDGQFCTGVETCDTFGVCGAGGDPCQGQMCDELGKVCVECLAATDCDDGVFCNGAEDCVGGVCVAGSDPCQGLTCDEGSSGCIVFCDDADVNCDGTVNAGDLLVVRNGANWEQPAGTAADSRTDVNADGTVNAGDLLVIRGGGVWETSTGPCVCP